MDSSTVVQEHRHQTTTKTKRREKGPNPPHDDSSISFSSLDLSVGFLQTIKEQIRNLCRKSAQIFKLSLFSLFTWWFRKGGCCP